MRPWHCLLLLVIIWMAGCQSYHSKDIDSQRIDQDLANPAWDVLRVEARNIHHPLLQPIDLDMRNGLSPDEAAIIAVLLNPSLRAQRDRRDLAQAQLIQAGILPNPQLGLSVDPVTGGNTLNTQTGWGAGLSWEITSLITHDARVKGARREAQSVCLDVAWQEWQVAQAASQAVYDLVALREQVNLAEDVDHRLKQNLDLIQRETDAHRKTLLDLSAAETASRAAHADLLSRQREMTAQRLALNELLGLPPGRVVNIQADVELPDHLNLPPQSQLLQGLGKRRLDLLALRRGYQSQEEAVRAAILAQFPKIALGFNPASDTSNVHTIGLGVTIDLPIFDRNQGGIAVERATRQQLFDEYVQRLFEAQSAIARAMEDIQALT
jgi:outer membrane protein TolC